MFFSEATVDGWIQEDTPYADLTTELLEIGDQHGRIEYFSREEGILCGTEEVRRIFNKLDIQTDVFHASGSRLIPGEVVISGTGSAKNLHMAWKVGQNLLDRCSGIATQTFRTVQAVHAIRPDLPILTTRKIVPGAKALFTKAIITGGALPHRMGLSETVLIFPQHMVFFDGPEKLSDQIRKIRHKACEKTLLVETESVEAAVQFLRAGADGVQLDKIRAEKLSEAVKAIRSEKEDAIILAAGGITPENAEHYARTGVDGLVTTSMYLANPLDMSARMIRIKES